MVVDRLLVNPPLTQSKPVLSRVKRGGFNLSHI